jgi:hypothetical protein
VNSLFIRKIQDSKEMQHSDFFFASPSQPRTSILSLLCLVIIAASATAASIEFAGIEKGAPVQNWSNVGEPKTLDLNNDDRFGGAGYYQITPGVFGENETWSNTVESSNDLGITQSYPTLFSKPDFLSENPLGAAGSFSNTTNSPDFMNPDGDVLIRQGALQPNFDNIIEGTVPGRWFWTHSLHLQIGRDRRLPYRHSGRYLRRCRKFGGFRFDRSNRFQ